LPYFGGRGIGNRQDFRGEKQNPTEVIRRVVSYCETHRVVIQPEPPFAQGNTPCAGRSFCQVLFFLRPALSVSAERISSIKNPSLAFELPPWADEGT
jgi:hypothetical protein